MEHENLLEACKKAISEHVEPVLQMDGGRIEVAGLDGKILQVRLLGTCGSCPSSIRAVWYRGGNSKTSAGNRFCRGDSLKKLNLSLFNPPFSMVNTIISSQST